MEFITRLGSSGDNTPYLHVMVMPPAAASQIQRTLPTVIDVKHTIRTSNNTLFDKERKAWTVSIDQILTSTKRNHSVRKLSNQFNIEKKIHITSINHDEAKILDLASEGIRIAGLEREEYLSPWGVTSKKVQKLLTNLSDRKIIQLYYEASNQNLISLATIIHGPPEKVTAVSNAFLDHTPTTLMMLDEKGTQSILISRLPKESLYELASELPLIGLEHGLTIRCLRPTTFQSYTHNLYQRLLLKDGTWDDDVSAFLSQARSKRKELSESNA